MKIDNLEIEELESAELLKNQKVYFMCAICFLIIGTLFGAIGLYFFANIKRFDEMWIMVPFCLVATVVFLWVGIKQIKKTKYIKAELDLREISEEEKIIASKRIKELMVMCVAIIVIGTIWFTSTVIGNLGEDHNSKGSNTCESCGRTWEAGDIGKNFINIADTGMCNKCEKNYHAAEKFMDDNSK